MARLVLKKKKIMARLWVYMILSYLFLSENQSVCSPRWHAIANMPIFFISISKYFLFSLLINNFEGFLKKKKKNFEGTLYSTLHIIKKNLKKKK